MRRQPIQCHDGGVGQIRNRFQSRNVRHDDARADVDENFRAAQQLLPHAQLRGVLKAGLAAHYRAVGHLREPALKAMARIQRDGRGPLLDAAHVDANAVTNVHAVLRGTACQLGRDGRIGATGAQELVRRDMMRTSESEH